MAKKWEENKSRNEIRRVQKALISYITGRGYNIWVSCAKKTKSRYYELFIARHKIRIRLSDHISRKIQNFDYDIYINKPRPNAFSYKEWLKDMEGKINAIEEQELAKRNSPGYENDKDCRQGQSARRSSAAYESLGIDECGEWW